MTTTPYEIRHIVRETVEETLIAMGVDISSAEAKLQLQRDNEWVRSRRLLEEKLSWKVILLIVTAAVGGVLGVIAIGFRTIFGNN